MEEEAEDTQWAAMPMPASTPLLSRVLPPTTIQGITSAALQTSLPRPRSVSEQSESTELIMYMSLTYRAMYAYSASPDDPNEVSFAKGDMLDVLEVEEGWVARASNRPPRSRAELARLIDSTVVEEALALQ